MWGSERGQKILDACVPILEVVGTGATAERYHVQIHWLKKGWTSNIEHLQATGKAIDNIRYLIWMEKDTVCPTLMSLFKEYDSD
jgi:hypothetical protein